MLLMVEQGQAFWLCAVCDESFFLDDDLASFHDCEGGE